MAEIGFGGYLAGAGSSFLDALTKAYTAREQRKYEEQAAAKKAEQDRESALELLGAGETLKGIREGTTTATLPFAGTKRAIPAIETPPGEVPLAPALSTYEQGSLQGQPAVMEALKTKRFSDLITVQKPKKELPEGFNAITDPDTKAVLYNKTFGTTYTGKDFKSQVAPITRFYTDSQGKLRMFTREGEEISQDEAVYGQIPAAIKTNIAGINTNLGNISGLREFINKTGSKNIGPVEGRTVKVGNRFFNNTDAQELINRNAQLLAIVYDLSGKAINENEMNWLKKEVLPDIVQPSENYEVTLNQLERWLMLKKDMVKQQYPGIQDNITGETLLNKESIPTFSTEEEAKKSGYKGNVIIAGRKARID